MKVAISEFELASVMTTDLLPVVEAGTVKDMPDGTLPEESVVWEPLRLTAKPLKVAESNELAAKLLPDTVTVEPTGPLEGVKVIDLGGGPAKASVTAAQPSIEFKENVVL